MLREGSYSKPRWNNYFVWLRFIEHSEWTLSGLPLSGHWGKTHSVESGRNTLRANARDPKVGTGCPSLRTPLGTPFHPTVLHVQFVLIIGIILGLNYSSQ